MHLAYIWIVSHLSAKNYQNWCKFDEVLTKTNLLSFLGHGVDSNYQTSPFAAVGGTLVKLASAIHKVAKYYYHGPKQS